MEPYNRYSVPLLNSYKFNLARSSVATKKSEVVGTVLEHYKQTPTRILFVGFCPSMFNQENCDVFVTDISPEVEKYLHGYAPHIRSVQMDMLPEVDCVVALNEYFTFADSDSMQVWLMNHLKGTKTKMIITSLRDYKNLDLKDRDLSMPIAVHNEQDSLVFTEFHKQHPSGSVSTTVTQIEEPSAVMDHYGPFMRIPLHFKRLARLSFDAGAKEFLVHKDLMYKSLIRRNLEHVISIRFK